MDAVEGPVAAVVLQAIEQIAQTFAKVKQVPQVAAQHRQLEAIAQLRQPVLQAGEVVAQVVQAELCELAEIEVDRCAVDLNLGQHQL